MHTEWVAGRTSSLRGTPCVGSARLQQISILPSATSFLRKQTNGQEVAES